MNEILWHDRARREMFMALKKIPEFKNEGEERAFWQEHDSAEFIDWSKAERLVLSKLKPSVRRISLRLPESMLEELKMFLAERIEKELGAH